MSELAKYSYFHRPFECSKCGQRYQYFITVRGEFHVCIKCYLER